MAVELYLHTYNETMIAIVVNLASGGNRNLGRTGEAVEEGEERKRQAGRQAPFARLRARPRCRRCGDLRPPIAYAHTYAHTGKLETASFGPNDYNREE